MTITDNIKTIRGNLSQRDFAKSINAHPSVIQSWESGRSLPGADYLIRIKEAYGVNLDWLLSGEGSYDLNSQPATIQEHPDPEFKISDLVTKTVQILESSTIYKTALAHNINAFHQALSKAIDIDQRFAAIERQMTELKTENAILKRSLEMLQQKETEESLPDRRAVA